MAVGDQLLVPATGHVRFDVPGCVTANGTWITDAFSGYYGGTILDTNEVGSSLDFTFTGTSIEITGVTDYRTILQTTAQLWIDGINRATISNYNAAINMQDAALQRSIACITGLSSGTHTGKIVNMESKYLIVDAIDVDTGCTVTPASSVTRRRGVF
ncbi:MAG: hypothetical protein VB133_07470 [Anaeromusa sp.]|uniref:hypothetical protein n=1 Tax=Anaeromusa sp. TaxID=1872520 RepID=UPI002B21629E|nr:hypothetical protein [Anaeromusa sp.]MEA4834955.1 hypothetical protein [Anaeromusa sp.]